MRAAALGSPGPIAERPLHIVEAPKPELRDGYVLLRVRACGVCRTDLHVVEGELPPLRESIIPGYQIVGEIVEGSVPGTAPGARVGVSWIGGTDGTCTYCLRGMENLCDAPAFTGYSVNGGYAEYALARSDFVFPLPDALDDLHAAPLLCAGIIGFRSLRVAGVEPGDRVGLFGFGASAHLAIAVLQAWHCEVYVSTRGSSHRALAQSLGAVWAGDSTSAPPELLDAAIVFAPIGELVPRALKVVRKGGTVVCGGIHMSDIPSFPYELLWQERMVCSVANLTRRDGEEFLALAPRVPVRTEIQTFRLAEANQALSRLRHGKLQGAAVLMTS